MSNIDFSIGDDLGDLIGGNARGPVYAAPRQLPQDEQLARIRETAEGGHFEQCPKCRGTGQFRSYTGRSLGSCFACKGKGGKTYKQSAEKRAETRQKAADRKARQAEEARSEWAQKHPEHAAWLETKLAGSLPEGYGDFLRKMRDAIDHYGDLTPNQMAAIERGMARDAEYAAKKAAQAAAKAAPAAAQTQAVTYPRIRAAFEHARSSGLRKASLRSGDLKLSLAPEHGRNPGALYVMDAGVYAGLITRENTLRAGRDYTGSIELLAERLATIEKNPAEAARLHGQQTGTCSCCGAELTDPVSIARSIGPICEGKWGF